MVFTSTRWGRALFLFALVAGGAPVSGVAQDVKSAVQGPTGTPRPFEGDARVAPDAPLMTLMAAAIATGDLRIDALLSGYKWSSSTVTYSFYSSGVFNGSYYGSETGVREVSAAVKQNVRNIMAFYGAILNLQLVEVSESTTSVGAIRIMLSDQQSYAYTYYPSSSAMFSVAGDVHLNSSYDGLGDTNGFQNPPGYHGYMSLIHEIGHALGLKHPFDNTPNLPSGDDNTANTVMSYTFVGNSSGTPMGYDVMALQYLYGARALRTTNDTYSFTRPTVDQYSVGGQLFLNPSASTKQTIWDAGGANVLDVSQVTGSSSGYRLDLKPLGWLTTGGAYHTTYYDAGTSLGPGVRILNVLNSVSDDVIYANADANVFGGYAPGRQTGNDIIVGAAANDTLDLSAYSPSQVAQTTSGNDLVLGLGSNGSVTLRDYYAGARPQILFGSQTWQLSVNDITVTEGNSGTTTATFLVTLSAPAPSQVLVNYTTSNGTATAGSDYVSASGTVTFAPGETQKGVAVSVMGDTAVEADETFALLLSAPTAGVVIAKAQGNASIVNDDQVTGGNGGGSGTATFVRGDLATQGNWLGKFGVQGYALANIGSAGLSSGAITVNGALSWTWTSSTAEPRALLRPDALGHTAATWYSFGTLSVDVNLTDGQTHQLAVYCLDWDYNNRTQKLEMLDPVTGAVLDSRTLSAFSGGQYLVWRVSGAVRLRVTNTGPSNAVVGGIFLDPVSTSGNDGASASAAFVKVDTATQGTWGNVYGRDGFSVANDRTALPAYATVAVGGQLNYTWSADTSDVRALQKVDGSGRLAATWYNASAFTIDVSLNDSQLHQLALYCLDWDANGRVEQVEILDPSSGAVLDSRTVSAFSGGRYIVWQVRGAVRIRVTNTGPANAVVSGIFLDPPNSPGIGVGAGATFVTVDSATHGTWRNTYGRDGFSLANDGTVLPAYATVAVGGQLNYTWSASTSDVRALQNADGSSHLAATWYNGSSFTLDVSVNDGQTHQLAIYCLDWDNNGRVQEIEVLDQGSGAVLDSRTLSGFSAGQYVVWQVQGTVRLRVTNTGPANAVVNGVFLDPPAAATPSN